MAQDLPQFVYNTSEGVAMPRARTLGWTLLLVAAACTRTPATQAPQPLKPEDGPKTSITVDYTGGLFNRSLHAYFRTEQYAYVMVGHLGGDGRIRVLYPESPDESGYIRGKKQYRTAATPAYYDAVPSLFSYTVSPHRGLGARHDSYDGRGHGYVFMIASRTPLRYGLLYDYAGWAELEMEGYTYHHDPRYAIRGFADVLSGGAKYTLKFATSAMTSSYSSYASRAWDCSVLNSLGMFANAALWSSWQTSMFDFGSMNPLSSCGGSRPMYANRPIFTTVVRPPLDPTGDPAPTLDRPGRRGLGARTETHSRDVTLTRVSPGIPRDPTGGREAFDRSTTRRPSYGARRGTTSIDARTGRETTSSGSARADRPRAESPRAESPSRGSSPDRGSSGSSSSGASSSSGSSRSGSEPTSSPSERRRPN
jgi:hypothetical protein